LPSHTLLPEPQLSFHSQQKNWNEHPLRGLLEFGPLSSSLLFSPVPDTIRLATICPREMQGRVQVLVKELNGRQIPRERREYLPAFEGFSRVFRTRLALADSSHHIEMPAEIGDALERHKKPHLHLAEVLKRCIQKISGQRLAWDVLLIALPEAWRPFCFPDASEEFDLHDFLKEVCANSSIPLQIILGDHVFDYACRASVTWRLGLALYCKAGGIPWKLAEVEPDTAYIGLSYALRSMNVRGTGAPDGESVGERTHGRSQSRFVTCCSQVFDAEGTGLEFIAYDASARDVTVEGDNPHLSRAQMLSVVSRSLDLYRRQHNGQAPRRVVIHKTTHFKPEEVDGCFDAWAREEDLDLVQVQQDVMWRGVHFERAPNGKPAIGGYPCPRGIYLPLSGYDVLLWTQGDVPQESGRHYYKEGKGIPHPLLLTRFAGRGGWEDTCRTTLGLSKMNWNNDALYDPLPVTLSYASTLARVFKRIAVPSPHPYQFRFFM